jgi:hypothetical protein
VSIIMSLVVDLTSRRSQFHDLTNKPYDRVPLHTNAHLFHDLEKRALSLNNRSRITPHGNHAPRLPFPKHRGLPLLHDYTLIASSRIPQWSPSRQPPIDCLCGKPSQPPGTQLWYHLFSVRKGCEEEAVVARS